MSVKESLLLTFVVCILLPTVSVGRDEPLANDGIDGLYVRSMEQVLRLEDDQVDLATAALIASERWSDVVPGRRYLERLDEMAYEVRDIIETRKLKAQFQAIHVINEYLFDTQGFETVAEATDPNDLFLHTVLDEKRGYCLSLSVLYLSIGERLGLPLYGVVVPGHFFVRYDDGNRKFNIETTSRGATPPDQHYIDKFKVPQYDGSVYMTNLGKIQTLGCLFNNLGNTYSGIGDFDTAMEVLENSVVINPELAESRMNLGNIYLRKHLVEDAIEQYREALDINPNDAKAHLNLGNAYGQKGYTSRAIAEYKHSLKLDRSLVESYKNLAVAYCKENKFPLALMQLRYALKLNPKDADAYSQLGDVYSRMGDCNKAMTHYSKALAIKPRLAQAYYGRAMCYNKQGIIDKEIEAHEKALAIDPRMIGALVNLGNAYVAKEQYAAAIELYRRAVQLNPYDATIYYNFGTACTNSGDFAAAVTQYEKALEIDPAMGDVHNGLAYSFYRLNRYDSAMTHISKARELGVQVDPKLLNAIKSKLR